MKFADLESENVIAQIHQYRNPLPIDQPQQRILMIQTQEDGDGPRLIIVSERPEVERRVLVIQENQEEHEPNHGPLLMIRGQEQTPQYQTLQGHQENVEEPRYTEYSACDEKDVEIISQQPMDCEPPQPLQMMTVGSETTAMNPPIFYNTALRTFQVAVSSYYLKQKKMKKIIQNINSNFF